MAIELIDTVTPANNQPYPIVNSDDIKGGYHSVKSITERDSIPKQRRQANMLCYVDGVGMFRLNSDLSTWISADSTATFEMEVDGETTGEYSLAIDLNTVSGAYGSIYENLYTQFQTMFREMQRTIDAQQRKINDLEARVFALESGMGNLPEIKYDDVITDYDGLPLLDYMGYPIDEYEEIPQVTYRCIVDYNNNPLRDYNGYSIDDYGDIVVEKRPYLVDYNDQPLVDYRGNVLDEYNISIAKDANTITDYENNNVTDYNGQPIVDYGNVVYLKDYKGNYLTDYEDNRIFMKEGVV